MRSALVLLGEVGRDGGPDLTRYFVVCVGAILALLAIAWVFRRFLAERLKARARKRSLQVLDVLPLSGKQKLVVVRCYDRSFLLGLGDKEVRSIAELELEPAALAVPPLALENGEPQLPTKVARPFAATLQRELGGRPAAVAPQATLSKEGVVA